MIAGITDTILHLHGWAALALIFAVPALEASAFVGFIFPGEIAVLLGGVLAYQGRISLGAALAAAIMGAVIGDSAGYLIGREWGRAILRGTIGKLPVMRRHIDKNLDRAEEYLRRRGPHAVVLGRFTAGLRVMVPGLAGMSRMRYWRFLLFNVIGGALWATTFVLLGYFGGVAVIQFGRARVEREQVGDHSGHHQNIPVLEKGCRVGGAAHVQVTDRGPRVGRRVVQLGGVEVVGAVVAAHHQDLAVLEQGRRKPVPGLVHRAGRGPVIGDRVDSSA